MIEFKDVSFQYEQGSSKGKIENINLTIHDGEVVLICGESGCGKTTLTRLINGLIPHYYEGTLTGQTIVEGVDVKNVSLYALSGVVGSVFQNPRTQFFHLDTTGEMAFNMENLNIPHDKMVERLKETAWKLDIQTLMDRDIFQLSGGEKQQIACGSVYASMPEVIVMDEPSMGLSPIYVNEIFDIIQEINKSGTTVLLVEQNAKKALSIANRAYVLETGDIVLSGDAKELMNDDSVKKAYLSE